MAKNLADLTGARPAKNGNGHGSKAKGLHFGRFYTPPGSHAFDLVEWKRRTAAIPGEEGQVIYEQKDVEVPRQWSQLAINVVAQKYFRGSPGSPERETSVRQIIDRVVDTLAKWGREGGYFSTDEDVENWAEDLRYLLVTQHASFNSPVWFNIGVPGRQQQASACFINAVNDSMESILDLAKTEGMLFKYGSGTGSNLSSIRSSRELLAGGGTASGPVSFMKGYDSFAGSIKSGGTTRRAAKMVILNADHPDVVDFIHSKAEEEKKAWALIEAGYNVGFNVPGGAYDSVQFQNANHSVRVTDDFMRAYEKGGAWETRAVTDRNRVMATFKARDLMRKMAESAWVCGDPGMQFDTTVNDWHPCSNTSRINASNPCSEYMFLDDSACNLASLNLMRFYSDANGFDVEAYRAALRVVITAQEITVDNASYPTEAIERNSHAFRPLGIGYANLGALLMARGLPYDSDEGRDYAAAVTSILSGESYAQSARIAERLGPFAGYGLNEEPFLRVIDKHRRSAYRTNTRALPADLADAATKVWDEAYALGQQFGYRNAQISVLAPTGTIAFMMDCDTTGIEPDIALVKYKKLVGGGMLKIVNQTVPIALKRLGYDQKQINEIVQYIDENDTIEGAPHLLESHLAVFDCAFKPAHGTRSIAYMGHVRMMGAVQPFISGAISKTINMPTTATVEEIEQAYYEAWRLGLKAVAVYRDGCKRSQPLSTAREKIAEALGTVPTAVRRKLPDERESITHKFSIGGHE